jgi:selenocysteine-specific elongation factor
MIVATAGHVDHGKTTLVKALTGVDTDRLDEEKRRGMSIDLGFAYADFGGDSPIGFVDVPGHERFVRNMLAGVAAIDFALLVIAADDGPMPQTAEHLAILDLLGVSRGAVALTKIDRVPQERVGAAAAEIEALLYPTALRNAPIFPLTATTGEGVPQLKEYLAAARNAFTSRSADGNFRLAVDRCFSLAGTGLVVTGAVFSGAVAAEDRVIVSPQGISARVRGIRSLNRPAATARAGQRCALNLAGTDLKRIEIRRGDWIVAPAAHAVTTRIDVQIKLGASETRPLRHWAPVHLHIGAAAVNARVAPLEGREIAPGEQALAQLVLDAPVVTAHGDRFILRDQSARHTIGGGAVLDPFGPQRARSRPERLAQLVAMAYPAPADALRMLLDMAHDGLDLGQFVRARNLTPEDAESLLNSLQVRKIVAGDGLLGVAQRRWDGLREEICGVLRDWHKEQPESIGLPESVLAARTGLPAKSPVLRAAIRSLLEDRVVARYGMNLHLPEHHAKLSDADQRFLEKLSPVLQASGLRPPIVGELATVLGIEQTELLGFLERLAQSGHLVRIARNRFFLPATVSALAQVANALACESADGTFDAAAYRDRSGIGRNLTIEVLEYLDHVGVTRFAGGKRRIVAPG